MNLKLTQVMPVAIFISKQKNGTVDEKKGQSWRWSSEYSQHRQAGQAMAVAGKRKEPAKDHF